MTSEAILDDPELELITPFLPEATRGIISALHALHGQIRQGIFSTTDESLARVKLAWWRDELERLLSHEPSHPATQALADALRHSRLDARQQSGEELSGELGDLLEGLLMQLEARLYNDDDEMLLHCWRSDAVLIVSGARLCGVNADAGLEAARHYGMARALARLVLHFEADRRSGRCWLPEARLKALSLSPESLLKAPPDRHSRVELLTPLADLATHYFDSASDVEVSDRLQRDALRPAVLMATASMQALSRARKTDFQDRPVGRLRQLFGIWRAARREARACRH
jgi:15-cis-phytoene synthase